MAAFVSGARFGRQIAVRSGIFLVLTLGFPVIVYIIILATNARSVGGASGAVAVVAAMYLKPVIIGAFVLSLAAPCWRRMRSLEIAPYWGLLPPFMFAMDWAFLMIAGAHWGTAFALGILRINAPIYAMAAIILVIAMVFGRPGSGNSLRNARKAAGSLAVVLVGLTFLAKGLQWWGFSVMMSSRSPDQALPAGLPTSLQWASWIAVFQPFVCFALCGAAIWLAILSRSGSDGGHSERFLAESISPTT